MIMQLDDKLPDNEVYTLLTLLLALEATTRDISTRRTAKSLFNLVSRKRFSTVHNLPTIK